MKSRVRTVQCSSPDCRRIFATSSRNPVLYCEDCRIERLRESRRRFERSKRVREYELVDETPVDLNEKLENAEFSILYDAGPKDCAFRRGARLDALEVHYMLKYETLAENSILQHNRTKKPYRVIRNGTGGLSLDPPLLLGEKTTPAGDGRIE